ncbi:RNA-binding cell elongation regulator Jag/EloR [Desulfurispira natronophila]|uniref:SpoIIIJ-associated protein n=1 Tax=Desulfurispira natronophila TaxID=682562 RepID=A0A7W7Y362_9BACT|nr:RNA-binding cell elongation regulator Jag/EloR [Desulfurispira natronophila]MBB5021217.1 spoIIIJ-associated protein [Desulfurispira natronophila]
MKVVEIEGKSVNEAIEEALEQLGNGITRDQVSIEVLEEGTRGLFGLLGTKPTRVRVSYAPEQRKLEETQKHLEFMLEKMGIEVRSIERQEQEDGSWLFHIQSADDSSLRHHSGEPLEAIAFILSRMVNQSSSEHLRIALDSNNFLRESELAIREEALDLAQSAIENGRSMAMRNMNSRERKIVHMAIQDLDSVKTVSSGEGYRRRVIIIPDGAERRSGNGRRQNNNSGRRK